MTTLIFDTHKHLTPGEMNELQAYARSLRVSLPDLIERTLKQRLYAESQPALMPTPPPTPAPSPTPTRTAAQRPKPQEVRP